MTVREDEQDKARYRVDRSATLLSKPRSLRHRDKDAAVDRAIAPYRAAIDCCHSLLTVHAAHLPSRYHTLKTARRWRIEAAIAGHQRDEAADAATAGATPATFHQSWRRCQTSCDGAVSAATAPASRHQKRHRLPSVPKDTGDASCDRGYRAHHDVSCDALTPLHARRYIIISLSLRDSKTQYIVC
jgi:hypothetical protein